MSADGTSSHRLQLRGALTIRTIAKAHKKLASAFAGASEICIDLGGATDADLSLVQLLHSAHSAAQRDGKSMRMTQPLPDVLLRELRRGGFLDTANTFWTSAG